MSCRLLIKYFIKYCNIYWSSILVCSTKQEVGGGSGKLLKIYGVKKLSLFTDSPLRAKESWSLILVTSI